MDVNSVSYELPKQEPETRFPMTMEQEQEHLTRTYGVIQKNVQNYRDTVKKMSAEVDSMIAHFHDDNPEILNILQNSVMLNENAKRTLFRNEQALKKAYFGRIDYVENGLKKKESIYIGKSGVSRDTIHIEVVDWRAPIAAAYYESRTGKCTYRQPDGKKCTIDVGLKRTYEVDRDRLIDFYDSETVANDELLTKYLAKNKQAVLGEIIASIQKEQDDIIRKSPFSNVLVQGVAGSGKTTVAMHRISYIMYNYPEHFHAKDFYIIGSNHILLNYITGVLPELDVYEAKQMTMEELFTRLLYETWDKTKYSIVPVVHSEVKTPLQGQGAYEKGTSQWFFELSEYCKEFEWKLIKREDINLNKNQFVQGFYHGTAGVHDISADVTTKASDIVPLVSKEEVERYIRENPTVSVMAKKEMLNQKLESRIDNELIGKFVSYTPEEKKAIRRAYRGWYGKKGEKQDIFEIYRDFIASQNQKSYHISSKRDAFDVYDLAALAYLYKRIIETDKVKEASHIVIDEAQDFGMMVYMSLKYCIPGCTYTIMGDVSQNISFGYGLSDWEELKKLILTDDRDSFGILKKSYRNTVEIANLAGKILRHGGGRVYVPEPVIRHGDDVVITQCAEEDALILEAAKTIRKWQQKDFNTIAVICRNKSEADRIQEKLGKIIPLQDNRPETATFGAGVIVLTVEYTKGLEFDAVLILEPDKKNYPADIGHAKLLYVAATRALHELCILHCNPLSVLISEPVPEDAVIEEITDEGKKQIELPDPELVEKMRLEKEERDRELILKEASERSAARENKLRPGTTVQKTASHTAQIPVTRRIGMQNTTELHSAASNSVGLHSAAQKSAVLPVSSLFGEAPDTALLKQKGHSLANQAVRWVEKRSDGMYLISNYGILRVCMIGESMIRVSFSKGHELAKPETVLSAKEQNPFRVCRDQRNSVELVSDKIVILVDKASCCLRYMTTDKRQSLSERARICRLIEADSTGKMKLWQFFDWQRSEELYGISEDPKKKSFRINGKANYLSGADKNHLPWLYSSKDYAIVVLSGKDTIVCDTPAYGSFFCSEGDKLLDYCIIFGKSKEDILQKKHELDKGMKKCYTL